MVVPPPARRVLLADDQRHVRHALRLLVTHALGLAVVGEADDMASVWGCVEERRLDVVLLDWSLVLEEDATVLTRLRTRYPSLQIIVLSGQPEARTGALAAGVATFVSKADGPDQILAALHRVLAPGGHGHTPGRSDRRD